MPEYEPQITTYTKPVNILMRLTKGDTRFLYGRIRQAMERATGVNLIFVGFQGAFSLVYSPERGTQIKCIGYQASGNRVESDMKGYNGPWSHVELTYPVDSLIDMERFIEAAHGRQPQLL